MEAEITDHQSVAEKFHTRARSRFGSQTFVKEFRSIFVLSRVAVTYRDHLSLGGHEGGPVAEPKLGLQRVEVDLQLALLLHFGRFVEAAVISEVLQLLLHGLHGVLGQAVLQPRDGATDPLQQLGC